jgi:hypothetical protein
VVRVFGYRSGGPVSIPGTPRKNVVGLERGPLSLVSTTEELLDCKKLAITSPTSGGRSVGIVRSQTQKMEFYYYRRSRRHHHHHYYYYYYYNYYWLYRSRFPRFDSLCY